MSDEPLDGNEEFANIIMGMSDHTTDPARPFTGQPHTDNGKRGQAEVRGIRFRDLADCVVKAWVDAAAHTVPDESKQDELRRRADDGTLNYNDLYALECGDIDPLALVRNVGCRVEMAMGIYPNVSPLACDDLPEDSQ